MGRHESSGLGNRRRFLIAITGILVLAFGTLAIVALIYPN
jgi:hypothetical protein